METGNLHTLFEKLIVCFIYLWPCEIGGHFVSARKFSRLLQQLHSVIILLFLPLAERLDQDTSGILTTICNHSFHCSCISKWTDSSCPVSTICCFIKWIWKLLEIMEIIYSYVLVFFLKLTNRCHVTQKDVLADVYDT